MAGRPLRNTPEDDVKLSPAGSALNKNADVLLASQSGPVRQSSLKMVAMSSVEVPEEITSVALNNAPTGPTGVTVHPPKLGVPPAFGSWMLVEPFV
jgi:hypothetical protein